MSRESDDRIREGLERRADRAGLVPSSLGEVQRRARGIRRRRTAWTAGAAAAAIVVVAGVAVALGPGLDHEGAPAPATTSPRPLVTTAPPSAAPSPSTPTGPSTAVDPSTPTSTSAAPASYVVDTRKVVEGTGPSLLIPNWLQGTLADGHGGHAVPVKERPLSPVLDARTGQWHAMVVDSTGEIRWNTYGTDGSVAHFDEAASASVAVTPDGRTYAVLLKDGGLGVRLQVAGAQRWETAIGGGSYEVRGFLPDGGVVITDAQDRPVVIHRDGTRSTVPGTVPLSPAGAYPVTVNPVTGRIAAPATQQGGHAPCWGLVDESGDHGPQTCDQLPMGFSADGSLAYAVDAGTDNAGGGVRRIRVLDGRTLALVATFTAAKGQTIDVLDAAWMGDQLAVPVRGPVDGTDSWEIALLSPDNGVTMIHASARPARGEGTPPYSFGAGPLDLR